MSAEGIAKLKNAFKEVLNTKIRKDQLNVQIQGISFHPTVIKKEISNAHSPFNWKGEGGMRLVDNSEWDKAALEISKALYNTAKQEAIDWKGAIRIVDNNFPAEFSNPDSKEIRLGYDDTKKIIYYYSPGDVFRSFTETFLKGRVWPEIYKKYPEQSYVYVFLKPNEDWIKYRKEIARKARAQAKSEGKASSTADRYATQAIEKARGEYKARTGRLDYEGVEFGHTFGAAATGAAYLLESPDDLAHQDISKAELIESLRLADADNRVINTVKKIIQVDTNLDWERLFNGNTVETRITLLVPEDAVLNRISGSKTARPLSFLRQFVKGIKGGIEDLEGSPSHSQLIEQLIEDLFLGKTPKSGRLNRKTNIETKTTTNIKVHGVKGSTGRLSKRSSNRNQSAGSPLQLQSLISLINRRLHDKIRENMGKGGSKQILNYRTGRFARSAKVQNLYGINEKRALGAQVKYMRNPYGVFEPGGRLNPPAGRDPHRIIGRSIRQILQEEKIANLRRVKVKLNG
jgi:hypothetical protein